METGKHAGQARDLSEAREERVGPYQFALTRREVGTDSGLTLHVFGPVGGAVEEILRFDCFEQQPHYHLGWSYRDVPFIEIEAPQPFEWMLDYLEQSFDRLIVDAGADSESISGAELKAVLERIRAAGRKLETK